MCDGGTAKKITCMKLFLLHGIVCFFTVYLFFKQEPAPLPYNAVSTTLCYAVLFGLLWLSTWFYRRSYFYKLPQAIELLLFFLKELFIANLKIAYDIVTPHYHMRPTVIALPLKVRSKVEITVLASIISLTPGTLSIDVSEDRRVLYIHALYVKHNDIEKLKHHIKYGFERRILQLTK